MLTSALPEIGLDEAGFRSDQIDRLARLIEAHIAEGRYLGAQFALARHGRLAAFRTFGRATRDRTASADTLWLLYSQTKVVTAVCLWVLAERGGFRFTDRVCDHLPEFAAHGKEAVSILQLLTHQGGFPNAPLPEVPPDDHAAMRRAVCAMPLEWEPGSRLVYHSRSAYWTAAMLIEALAGCDYRLVIRETVLDPLGIGEELMLGLPDAAMVRTADMHAPLGETLEPAVENNAPAWKRGGSPSGGGYATARALVTLYQMLLRGGELGGTRILGPRTLAYAIRDWTGERIDEDVGLPMFRGLGPHLRGRSPRARSLGNLASAATFGHAGVGSSCAWGDPESGVSFAYLTNARQPDPWSASRFETVSDLVHAAIL